MREFAVYRHHLARTKGRPAFTLIELLVVIAIIGILVSLLAVGIFAIMGKPAQMTTRNDILQLSQGVQKFKQLYGMFPPSKIRLYENLALYNQPDPTGLNAASIAYIAAIWPNIQYTLPGNATQPYLHKWAGPGVTIPNTGVILEGDQCLVFFLGGIPNAGIPQGFSVIAQTPAVMGGDRKKCMDFPNNRLVARGGSPFASYIDGWGTMPYVYFNSGKRPDGYDTTPINFGTSSVGPYISQAAPTIKFYNSDTFQIISAGADMKFGPGGLWTPQAATGIAATGKDDMTNFYDKFMGVP